MPLTMIAFASLAEYHLVERWYTLLYPGSVWELLWADIWTVFIKAPLSRSFLVLSWGKGCEGMDQAICLCCLRYIFWEHWLAASPMVHAFECPASAELQLVYCLLAAALLFVMFALSLKLRRADKASAAPLQAYRLSISSCRQLPQEHFRR